MLNFFNWVNVYLAYSANINVEFGAFADNAFNINLTSHLLNQVFADAQT